MPCPSHPGTTGRSVGDSGPFNSGSLQIPARPLWVSSHSWELRDNDFVWGRLTERAKKVIWNANEIAREWPQGYVATEHLLLGLCQDPSSTASLAVRRLGLTPRAKRVIDLAYDEAQRLANNFIGTEHLLLGLAREHDGLAGRTLVELGLELEELRDAVSAVQSEQQGASVASIAGAPDFNEPLRNGCFSFRRPP
jgi:ATP-dependent Clp protease ATP-binding subunit ClpC